MRRCRFQLDEPAGEELRLKYRFSICAATTPAAAIRLRSRVECRCAAVLARHDFVEIETPAMLGPESATSQRRPDCTPVSFTPYRRARSCSSSC